MIRHDDRMSHLPPVPRMYRAVIERDSEFAGVFVVAVKTTGVFCRVGCRAKAPKLENCEFFASSQQALYAGYRPCLRCRPLERIPRAEPIVEQLLALLEAHPRQRLTDERLRSFGVEPTTARRQFRRHCGMTFHAYQRARRLGMAFDDLRRRKGRTSAMRTAGYDSESGFSEAFHGIFGAPPSDSSSIQRLVADWIVTPLGPMIAVADDDSLLLLEFHDRRGLEPELDRLRSRRRAAIVPGANPVLKSIRTELDAYFQGALTKFSTPVALDGSEFQRRVWSALQAIPFGQTRSYRDIAVAVDRPAGVRAVGRANGENCLALIVPCHRVIRSDGDLCGYGGGIWRKKWLLDLEANNSGASKARTPSPPRVREAQSSSP